MELQQSWPPFDQAGSYFDEDQGLIIGSDGLKYWHKTNNTMKNENGDSIYLSKQERDSLSAYLRVRQHEQDSWDGSFRTNRTGRTTCTTIGMNTVCTTTSY